MVVLLVVRASIGHFKCVPLLTYKIDLCHFMPVCRQTHSSCFLPCTVEGLIPTGCFPGSNARQILAAFCLWETLGEHWKAGE